MVQGILSALILSMFVASPIVFGMVLYRYAEDLDYRSLEKKIGSMY